MFKQIRIMGKDKNKLLKSHIKEIGEDIYYLNDDNIVCKICTKPLGSREVPAKKSQLEHLKTGKHIKNANLKNQQRQGPIRFNNSSNQGLNQYYFDLTKMMVGCDIPLNKLENSKMEFLEKCTKYICPDRSTLIKSYLKVIYEETIDGIRRDLVNEKLWISIDETCDSRGKCIGNVVKHVPYILSLFKKCK